jgi:hypothetical protein
MVRLMSLSLARLKVIWTVGHGKLGVLNMVSLAKIGLQSPSEDLVFLHSRPRKDVTHSEAIAARTNAVLQSGVIRMEKGRAKCGG